MANSKSKSTEKKRTGFIEYMRGVRTELKKVVWPTKRELGSYTIAVILFCAVMALGFWAIDSGCALALQKLLGITISL
ncbi:MAG: preprotein translocase subunit SecE [Anaerovoracaceae bacterium]|jgi:preprotein translocase subunit SecE